MKSKNIKPVSDIWELEFVDSSKQLDYTKLVKNHNVKDVNEKFFKFSLRHLMSNKHLTGKMINGKFIACLASNEELST